MKKFSKGNKLASVVVSCSVVKPNSSNVLISVGKKRENALDKTEISYETRKQRRLSYVATLGTSLESIMNVGVLPSSIDDSQRLSLSMNPRNAVFKLMESLSKRNITGEDPLQSIVIVGCYSEIDPTTNTSLLSQREQYALKNKAEFYDSGNDKAPHIIGAIVEIQRVHKERARVRDIAITKNSEVRRMETNRYLYRLVVHYGGSDGFLSTKIAIQLGFSFKDLISAADMASASVAEVEPRLTSSKYFDSVLWYGYNSNLKILNNNLPETETPVKYQGVKSIRNRNIYRVRFKRLAVL